MDLAGPAYEAPGAVSCYGGRLVRLGGGGRRLTVVGDARPFTNDGLDDGGDAALALGLLGGRSRLVWYLPSLSDVPPSSRSSPVELVPRGVAFGTVELAVAVLLLALWRGRRLGAVVREPLPVTVPAVETVRGRGRLYRRAGARDRAAGILRAAARDRLAPLLGLPRGAPPAAVVGAVAARARRPQDEVGGLLYGAAPADDAALVRLATTLDALEKEVAGP